jgi:hypothetical protein
MPPQKRKYTKKPPFRFRRFRRPPPSNLGEIGELMAKMDENLLLESNAAECQRSSFCGTNPAIAAIK